MSSYGQSYGENALPHSRSQTPVADISRTASYASQRPDTSGTTGAQSIKSTGEYRTDTDAKSLTGSTKDGDANVSRQPSTLKKRNSVKRSSSLRRSGSRSRRSTVGEMDSENLNSAFYSPIPSHGNPTEILANRFNGWRRILKDFIAYFKEVQVSYEGRAKNTSRLFHTLNSAIEPEMFLRSGGILETNVVLKEYHKSAMLASEQAKQVELQIISSLSGLRNDLSSKIKEIKQLAGDFKNNLDKEREGTRRAVTQLADALSAVDTNPSLASGKNDPFIVKLAVDKQLKRQIAEENYLHRAYLNLESSGRELESIVVSEIQKAFESYMNILRMEGAELTDTAERLQTQTLNLPADHEWSSFIERDSNFVDPNRPVRNFDNIEYPGWNHPAGVEVRAGVLERKSKYLKSYTPGWYVLSPSHLHEFKTPDRMHDMTPVMSLYLPDCTMGSHTPLGAKSHKFMIKGRQTGAMHRGHSWVFRAESHEVMLGFFQDIQKLVELSGAERNAFVAQHQKQHAPAPMDGNATKEAGSSGSENGLENDEADEIPYSADRSALVGSEPSIHEFRPEGGRFPSDIDIQRRRSMRSNASGARSATSVESDRSIHAEPVVVPISQIQEPTGYRGEDERPLTGYDDERFEYSARGRPGMGERNASTFSYDAKHPPASTAYEGENFQPVRSNVPPEIERKMSKQTDPAELAATSIISPERRESTSSWTRTTPSRKPTATYGVDPVTGQPDPSASLVSAQPGVLQNQQPIATRNVNENTTSSLASYEAGAAAGGAGAGAYELYRAQADQRHAAVTQEAVPRGATSLDYETFTTGAPSAAPSNTANIHTVPSLTDVAFVPAASTPTEEPVKPTKSYGDLTTEPVQELAPPPAHRTNSNFTISDLHVPGGYPKQ